MSQLPAAESCVFCRIVTGGIPCHKLFENEHVLAMLDIEPLSRGHSLVVPKGHWVTIDQLPTEVAAACGAVVARLSGAVATATGARAWNVLQNNGATAGQAVAHVHFHIIPRREGDGLGYRWPAGRLDGEEARRLVETIRAEMT